MAKEELNQSNAIKHGSKEFVTHIVGKKKAKSEALKKKMESVKTSVGKVLRLHKGKE